MKHFFLITILSFCTTIGNSQTAQWYKDRGNGKLSLADNRGAIQDFNVAIKLEPNYARAYLMRGNNKFMLKDINGACLDYSKGGELGATEAYDWIKRDCK